MGAADRVPTALPGVGVLIPARLCALVADQWRASPVPEFRLMRGGARGGRGPYGAAAAWFRCRNLADC